MILGSFAFRTDSCLAAAAPAQVGKVLGQKGSAVLQKYYSSTVSGVDVQSIFQKRLTSTSDISELQRLKYTNNRHPGAPSRLTKEQVATAVQTPEVQFLKEQVANGAADRKELKNLRLWLQKEALSEIRRQYFESRFPYYRGNEWIG